MFHVLRPSRALLSRLEGWNVKYELQGFRKMSTTAFCGPLASGTTSSQHDIPTHVHHVLPTSPALHDASNAELKKPGNLQGMDLTIVDLSPSKTTSCENKNTKMGGGIEGIAEAGEENVDFPIPMSPFAGELSKEVELNRALIAEAAMKAGPAISKEDVLFEDAWLIVVNKPRGLYCEHVFATIPSLLTSTGETEPHLHMANRLDRDTSGVMVITKCREAAAKLTRTFTDRQVQKTYLALCAQAPPIWNHIKIESGHGRSRYGAWRVYAKQDVGRRLPGGSTVREMVTRLEILTNKNNSRDEADLDLPSSGDPTTSAVVVVVGGDEDDAMFRRNEIRESSSLRGGGGDEMVTVVRAFPETGRTHQIRLHCQYLGLPLCGDIKYGGPLVWQGVNYGSHALHAESLALLHPITCEPLQIVAPCPEWAAQLGVQPFLHKAKE